MTSSSTISSEAISTATPSRITVARGSVTTSSRFNSRRARTSWTTPITEFDSTTPTNSASCGLPDTSTSTNSVIMIALTTVKTFAATI